jgi:hypothetical protein
MRFFLGSYPGLKAAIARILAALFEGIMKHKSWLPIVVWFLVVGCISTMGERTSTPPTEAVKEPAIPAPLYFLSGDKDGEARLWRIEMDGVTQSLVVDCCIREYAVSSATGQIAYVTDGTTLIITDAYGEEIVAVDLDQVGYPHGLDSALAWSPDGSQLALGGESGLWFYMLELGRLIQMSGSPDYTTFIRPLAHNAWSPDGSAVLVLAHRTNAGVDEVGLMSIVSGEVRMTSILAGRSVTWTPDSKSFYVSSNFFGLTGILPSLLLVTTDDLEKTTLVESESTGDGLLGRYLEEARLGPDGLLYYFYGEGPVDFDNNVVGLSMYRSKGDGVTGRVLLREDVYTGIEEILWAEDVSQAIIVGAQPVDGNWIGTITIVPTDGERPVTVTPFAGYSLQWGQGGE